MAPIADVKQAEHLKIFGLRPFVVDLPQFSVNSVLDFVMLSVRTLFGFLGLRRINHRREVAAVALEKDTK